jgi:hypothetical protein
MPTLDFGQPERGIFQMAYVVDDIHAAMERWTGDLRVGPWFLLDRFTGVDPVYRGEPSEAAVMLAMGFAGHMQIELVQPLDDHPSPFREAIEQRGHGFHHYGIGSREFDADLARYAEQGYDVAFRAGVPTGGSVAYLDTNGALPGYIELIELGDVMEEVFSRYYAASLGWDGSDPVRPFG